MSKYVLLSLLAYFCGAIPSGVWIGKMVKGIDIRTVGSKNSGATNAYRTLGAKCGIATLILDALKGYLPLYIASHFNISDKYIVVIGLIAIFAHSMSCFLNFKGGKGVATSLGVFLFLAPKVCNIFRICNSCIFYKICFTFFNNRSNYPSYNGSNSSC